jgi:hypothetical protein
MALTPPPTPSPLSSRSATPIETPPFVKSESPVADLSAAPAAVDRTHSSEAAAQVPPNLFLEILSNLYSVPFDKPGHQDPSNVSYYLGERALERSNALRAMSQTCRDWRRTLLPVLYQSLEVGAIVRPEAQADDQWFIQCAERLISKCGGLADNPQFAWYTR